MVTAGRIRVMAVVVVVTLGLAASGCASTSLLPGHGHGHGGSSASAVPVGQDGPAAAPAELAVVRRWAAALQAGNLQAAAGYFHLPSLFDDGAGSVVIIHTLPEAEVVNATLTCGAKVISAFRQGRFINVLFRLTERAGRGGGPACGSGVGLSARTIFLIRDGQIVRWLRAASRPGDPGVPGSSSQSGTQSAPTTTTGTGTGSVI
jgi:uncharacterized protein YceK